MVALDRNEWSEPWSEPERKDLAEALCAEAWNRYPPQDTRHL